ncbi:MAG: hypothetical protein DWQ40_10345 [Actinobacteria bacterium]|nr:MAG: hypothetical protein DWQ40_10345 [Actinomycetota bacterium]
MDDRELRNRLQLIDPLSSGVEVRSVTDKSSQQILEKIMDHAVRGPENRPMQYFIGIAAVLALVIGGYAVFGGGTATGEPMELTLGGDAFASCLAPEAEHLRNVPVAFAGIATSVEGETVVLSVDEWYAGGDSATVELFAPEGLEALIGGIDFEVGSEYLISAENGTVNYCGLSGEATPELQAMYDEAFGG